MIETKTSRGFDRIEFEDLNGVPCSLQKSSLATEDAIWLGANEIGLKEFVAFRSPAWQDVELEQTERHHFQANTRIHLTRKMVDDLLPALFNFSLTSELIDEDETDPEEIRKVLLNAVESVKTKDADLVSLSARISQLEAENLALKSLAVAAVRYEQACDREGLIVSHPRLEKESQALSEAAEKVKAILEASA